MNNYELTVILRNRDVENLKAKVDGILKKNGITVVKEEPWGVRRLAYEIQGEKEGHYLHMIIESAPDAVKKVIGEFRIISEILRYLFVKLEKEKAEAKEKSAS